MSPWKQIAPDPDGSEPLTPEQIAILVRMRDWWRDTVKGERAEYALSAALARLDALERKEKM